MGKERLDIILVNKGLVASRERAKSSIMAGLVFVEGQRVDKPGTMVKLDAKVEVTGDNIGYVSRGGLKLARALDVFKIDLTGKIMADIGASTGGFTDCALKNGAKRVYAIDVGYGQLAWSLRNDSRVVNMERTNIRFVKSEDLGELINFASIDVAFISLSKVLPVAYSLLADDGSLVALIKPQFEAGREKVGKKGVVRDPAVHKEVIINVIDCAQKLGFKPLMLTYSPIKGPEGNIEYLIYLTKLQVEEKSCVDSNVVEDVVQQAHSCLN